MSRQDDELARFRAKLEDRRLDFVAKELRLNVARVSMRQPIYDERRAMRVAQSARESLDDGAYGLSRAKRRKSR